MMKKLIYGIVCWWMLGLVQAQEPNRVFRPENLDFKRSPHTGLGRQHWKDAAHYLLEGAFTYIRELDDPMLFPKQPGRSYPRDGQHNATEMMEGLCRTLFMAAPLLREDPELTINGLQIADYYRHQLERMLDPSSPTYIEPRAKNGGPSQKLVEFGGLATALAVAPDVLWTPLSEEIKKKLSHSMLSYGDGPTIEMNWRFFNVMIMSFFKQQGYEVNESYLLDLLRKNLSDYRGDGWYTDSPYFDYYSMWAFQMYGSLWAELFGQEMYPDLAKQYLANLNDISEHYPYMFSENGEMIMYGRSISYRMGAAVPFPLLGLVENQEVNYGWMRRIASGTLLQFLTNPQLLEDNIPTLGFYGAFDPAVQEYTCRGSVFWMGKLFLGLIVPETSAFWTAKENNGAWEKEISAKRPFNKFAGEAQILLTDYKHIGASEIRSWSDTKKTGYYEGTENYNKLAYNSAFPWQADGKNGEISMNYTFEKEEGKWEAFRQLSFQKFENDVFCRKAVLASDERIQFDLRDSILRNGMVRRDVDRSTIPARVRFGHYALPKLDGQEIVERQLNLGGRSLTVIDNGQYQLGLMVIEGWDKVEVVRSEGLHPQHRESAVINVEGGSGSPGKRFTAVLLFKKSGQRWTKKDLPKI